MAHACKPGFDEDGVALARPRKHWEVAFGINRRNLQAQRNTEREVKFGRTLQKATDVLLGACKSRFKRKWLTDQLISACRAKMRSKVEEATNCLVAEMKAKILKEKEEAQNEDAVMEGCASSDEAPMDRLDRVKALQTWEDEASLVTVFNPHCDYLVDDRRKREVEKVARLNELPNTSPLYGTVAAYCVDRRRYRDDEPEEPPSSLWMDVTVKQLMKEHEEDLQKKEEMSLKALQECWPVSQPSVLKEVEECNDATPRRLSKRWAWLAPKQRAWVPRREFGHTVKEDGNDEVSTAKATVKDGDRIVGEELALPLVTDTLKLPPVHGGDDDYHVRIQHWKRYCYLQKLSGGREDFLPNFICIDGCDNRERGLEDAHGLCEEHHRRLYDMARSRKELKEKPMEKVFKLWFLKDVPSFTRYMMFQCLKSECEKDQWNQWHVQLEVPPEG